MVSLYGETGESLEHLGDFTLFASIKFMEALPLFDSKGSGRHVVFFFSVKQEVSIVTFGRKGDGSVEMITLFHGDIDTCFYQGRINEASLCCSGGFRANHDGVLLPLVAFSIHRGGLFLFNVAAAISVYGRKRKSGSSLTLDKLFSPEYVQNIFGEQKRQKLFTQGHFNALEFDVRSIAFGQNNTEKHTTSLFVLYADSSSKTHVSEYCIDLGMNEEQYKSQKRPTQQPWLPGTFDVFPRGGDVFRRKSVFLANVETNACLLHISSEGLFVLGPQLITFVSWKMTLNQSPSWKNVTTFSFPPFNAYVEPVCCASLPNRETLTFFSDGTYVKTTLKEEAEGLNSGKMVLVNVAMSSLRIIPDSLAILDSGYCVIGSRLTDTLWMKWLTGESGVLVDNCGPIFDLTVVADGPRMSVIASTGVGISGGLSLQRSAVNVRHDASIGNLLDLNHICTAGDVIILSFLGYSRIFRIRGERSMNVEEVSETPFDTTKETLTLANIHETSTFVQVTSVGINIVRNGEGNYIMRDDELGIQHTHADVNLKLLVFSSSNTLFVFDLKKLFLRAKLKVENEISCLLITSSCNFVTGEWNSGFISLYEMDIGGEILLKGRFLCSATPCSICVLSQFHQPQLVVGLLNGCIVDIPLNIISTGEGAGGGSGGGDTTTVRETLIKMQPVYLFNLESQNAVLCLGEVPLVIILSPTGFQLTGIDFTDVAVCSVVDNPHIPSKYLFFSKTEKTLVFGNIIRLKKLNSRFLRLNATVTQVKYITWWNAFVVSIRRNERDQVLLFMGRELANSWTPHTEEPPISLELLENERCVFLESILLGGTNQDLTCNEVDNDNNNSNNNKRVILVGTTFAFPDEQLSRGSRFMWYSVEQDQLIVSEPLQLCQLGSKDVEGALQCCCVVPNYSGRIALGINGCITLYSWNSADSVFIAEETVCIGTIVTRLIPIFQKDQSYIVAYDSRHSCFIIRIDIIQGGLKIIARDLEPRGVMDGVVYRQSGKNHNLCFGDDLFNFFSLSHEIPTLSGSSKSTSVMTPIEKLKTKAQYHLGDLVTAMQIGSFAPCSVVNDAVPIPNTLIPGICGPQIVFGTSHGSFGTITPVTNETYLLLKAIEVSVSAVAPLLGGFEHATYREVLGAGQERGYSRNASFETSNPGASDVFNRRRRRFVSKCVCSGDLIEIFLTFPESMQKKIVSEADMRIRMWCGSMKSDLEDFLEYSDLDHDLAGRKRTLFDECNTTNGLNENLFELGLPTLPLKWESVSDLVKNIQRIH